MKEPPSLQPRKVMDEFNKRLALCILSFFVGLMAQSWQHRPMKKESGTPAAEDAPYKVLVWQGKSKC